MEDAEKAPSRDLPAGVDPAEFDVAPLASARRGKLRRRLRYLRRVRGLLLRDLGGFTYELHRTGGGIARESHRRLAEAKARRLAALDAEVRELESRLNEPHVEPVLREPGIGGTCPECGELHASDAHYCSRCGAPLDVKARAQREAAIRAAAQPTTGAQPTPQPKPASVLWAAGPRPQAAASDEEGQQQASPATSEWLAARRQPAAPQAADPEAPTGSAHESPAAGAAGAAPADESAAAAPDEPRVADEPAVAAPDEPRAADEAVAAPDEPRAADEPPVAAPDEPRAADEPAVTAPDEPRAGDAPEAADEPAVTAPDEPRAGDAPEAADEPAVTAPDEPRTGDEPRSEDEPPVAADEPRLEESAADEAGASPPGGEEAGSASSGAFDPGPNGRRDDVVPPLAPGERLGSRREGRE